MMAVMQPYLFPYIGYFQLVAAAEEFVFYDDVQYINDGWINRNRLPDGWFTVPVAADSLDTPIADRQVSPSPYAHFRRKWLKRFALRYRRAPHYPAAQALLQAVFTESPASISEMAGRSVRLTSEYIGLDCRFRRAGNIDYDRTAAGQERLLGLLTNCRASAYVNPAGGRHLYQESVFAAHHISLRFLSSTLDFTDEETGFGYSILHLLAHHPPATLRDWLGRYSLTPTQDHEPSDYRST